MFVQFNGYGFVVLFFAAPPLTALAFLLERHGTFAMVLAGSLSIASGLACRHLGLNWNRDRSFFERHAFYWIPVEYWGWIYIACGAISFLGGSFRLLRDLAP